MNAWNEVVPVPSCPFCLGRRESGKNSKKKKKKKKSEPSHPGQRNHFVRHRHSTCPGSRFNTMSQRDRSKRSDGQTGLAHMFETWPSKALRICRRTGRRKKKALDEGETASARWQDERAQTPRPTPKRSLARKTREGRIARPTSSRAQRSRRIVEEERGVGMNAGTKP